MLRGGAAAATTVLLAATLLLVIAVAGPFQSHAHAAPYMISGAESCLALPAKAKWDPELNRCTLQGPLAVLAGDVLTVGQGVTFSADPRARLTNSGTIANSANATLLVAGKVTNAPGGTLVNSGLMAVSGIFSNAGALVNSADATLKNTGRITNSGTLTNSAGADLYNFGRITNNAIINNQGKVENRGALIMSEEAMLSSSAGATVKNSGRVMAYCGAQIAGTITYRPATDRCDDPPAAAMGAWSPFSPLDVDGEVDTVFTFKASASDDIKLAKVEWDFDGDGEVDYAKQLFGKSATAVATHSYGAQGVYHPQVRAVDSAGARSAWDRYSAAGLEAAGANAAPFAANATVTIEQDSLLELVLEAGDADGDELTFSISAQPAHGVLLGDAPELSYIPDEGYAGPDSFTFTASDGKRKSPPATVSITVGSKVEAEQEVQQMPTQAQQPEAPAPPAEPPNSMPVANGQSVLTMEEAAVSVRLTATDADGDWLEYRVVSEPAHGMLLGTAPDLTYMPDAEFYGHDSFAFMASDSFGGASTATISVAVGAVNDMPVAYDDDAATGHGASVSIDVLANDEDVEAEFLTIASVSAPQNGSAAPSGGLVTYSPNPGFSGADSFTYTISDGEGGAATATVTVAVAAAAPAPAPVPEPVPAPPQPQLLPEEQYCGRPASSFAHIFEGAEGNDELTGSKEDDLIIGKGGNDVLRGKGGNDCIVGGAGDDRMYGDKGLDVMEGGEGSDSMWGGAEDDKMSGGAGSDKVVGDGGSDRLWGDDGEDRLWGGSDNDVLNAGAGDDRLVGDGGSDVLNGEAGDDKIYDDFGDDVIDGGEGSDKCWDIIGSNQVLACEARS